MLKKFIDEVGKILISPVIYILALTLAGTGFIFFGVLLIFGEGIAYITLGVLMLIYMVALSRSVSGG